MLWSSDKKGGDTMSQTIAEYGRRLWSHSSMLKKTPDLDKGTFSGFPPNESR